MKRFSFLLLAAAALCFGAAFAQPGPPHADFDEPDVSREEMAQKLGLSAEQREQIRKTMTETRKQNIEAEAKTKIARIELHELLAADAPDQKKIDAKIAELSRLHETVLRNRVTSMLAVQKILTPEQRAKLKELRPFGERMRHRMGGSGHGPGMMGPHHMGPRPGMPPRGQQE